LLDFRDGGESHFSTKTTGIISGIPAGLVLNEAIIIRDLHRRQWGFGRGPRSLGRKHAVDITSGVTMEPDVGNLTTLGTPISLRIGAIEKEGVEKSKPETRIASQLTIPRPGHVDLVAALKYNYPKLSYGPERASARQTATYVAFGAISKQLIREICGIEVLSFVTRIGSEEMDLGKEPFNDITSAKTKEVLSIFQTLEGEMLDYLDKPCEYSRKDRKLRVVPCMEGAPCMYKKPHAEEEVPCMRDATIRAQIRCPDEEAAKRMYALIEELYDKNNEHYGDNLGGEFIVVALNVPIGLGSHVSWDRKIDGKLAQGLISIPAVKAVEFGAGFSSQPYGSSVHDAIDYNAPRGIHRKTNHAGGVEGGITNGEPIVMRAYVKPPPTLGESKALDSVDIFAERKQELKRKASSVRTDRCIVHGAGVIAESAVALTLADCILEKWGAGDGVGTLKDSYEEYSKYVRARLWVEGS
jgi:chorismate synthase